MTSLTEKAGFLIAANFIKYAVGFTLPMIMVRLLSKADYGTYQQLLLVNSVAVGVLALGLPSSVFYFYNRIEPARRAAFAVQTLLLLAAAGVVAALAIFLGAPAISERTSNPSLAGLLPVYGIAVGLTLAGEHFTSFMVAQDRYRSAVAFECIETVVRVAALVAPMMLGLGLPGLVGAAVLYAAGRCLVRAAWLLRTGPARLDGTAVRGRTLVRDQMSFALPLWLTSIVGIFGGTLDRAIVAGSFRPVDYAIYSVGAFAVPLDVIFQASVADVLRASLPPLVQRGEMEEVGRLLREAVRKLALIMLPSFMFLFCFADEFITLLFTGRYADSVAVFRIYLFGMPLFMFVLSLVPQVFGRTRINLSIVIVTTLVHTALSFTLLHWIGFYGPAASAVISSYLGTIAYLGVAIYLTGVPIRNLVPVQAILRTLACAAAGSCAALLAGRPFSHRLLDLTLHAAIFCLVFLGAGMLGGLFTPQDRSLAMRWAARLRLRPARA